MTARTVKRSGQAGSLDYISIRSKRIFNAARWKMRRRRFARVLVSSISFAPDAIYLLRD